jgi:predicted amidophosphoribosyltransferase
MGWPQLSLNFLEAKMTQYTIALGMNKERLCADCRHPVPGHELNCPVLLQEPQHAAEAASQTVEEIRRLRQHVVAQARYIEELEKQLEPSVVAEIRAELSETPNETY